MKKTIPLISTLVFVLSACVNTGQRPSQVDYSETYRQAYVALQKGEWSTYKKLMRIVIDRSTASNAPAEKRATYWYEYGRASGVVCDWEDAEFSLTVAYNLDTKSGGPAYMSMNELGRMSVARKQFDKAIDYFTRGVRDSAENQSKTSNVEYKFHAVDLRVLEEFAYALEEAKGNPSDIKRLKESAAEMRKKIPASGKTDSDITPYGTQCKLG
jgi:tetratricopeptide (TPR) repeat protein